MIEQLSFMDENQLIENVKLGSESAFQELVLKYQTLVINVCNNFLNNPDDALDIAQEVFIKVYQSINDFKGNSKFSTWLYRIAVNKSLNYIRSRKRSRIFKSMDVLFGENNDFSSQAAGHDKNIEESIEQSENEEALKYAMGKIPAKQKTAISLFHFEELSYKEIAEIMQISTTEVGVLINRAKKSLHKKIIDYFTKN